WIIQSGTNNIISKAEDFYSVTKPDAGTSGLLVRTQNIPDKYNTDFYKEITYVKVYSFDKPFFEYFKSKVNNRPVNDPFIQSGGAVAWNVYGENVIGLFIGVSEGGILKAE
ncbi:MAG TPA: hypothetical protein VLN45_00340, partial [Ignavibacteriaceae bacterium]|nr:hypothetical protein [Ignavibacteriaceae bacterium]